MKRIAVYVTDEEYLEIKERAGLASLSKWLKIKALEGIDTSDIPEQTDFSRAVRGKFAGPVEE